MAGGGVQEGREQVKYARDVQCGIMSIKLSGIYYNIDNIVLSMISNLQRLLSTIVGGGATR